MELAQIFFIGTVGATVGFALGVFITMAAYRKIKGEVIIRNE
jgi:ABC-type lipoprotein release transport system permease subunit